MKQRHEEAKSGKGKGASKKTEKGPEVGAGDLPRFYARRAFPGLVFGSWQLANRSLEAAETACNLIQCLDAAQVLLFQDMAKVTKAKDGIARFTAVLTGDPGIMGWGNFVWCRSW